MPVRVMRGGSGNSAWARRARSSQSVWDDLPTVVEVRDLVEAGHRATLRSVQHSPSPVRTLSERMADSDMAEDRWIGPPTKREDVIPLSIRRMSTARLEGFLGFCRAQWMHPSAAKAREFARQELLLRAEARLRRGAGEV